MPPSYALKGGGTGVLGTQAIKWNFTKFLVDRRGQVRGARPEYGPPKLYQRD